MSEARPDREPDRPTVQDTHRAAERGSGTVLGVAVALVLVVGLAFIGLLAQAAAGASKAATAADLAALAGADAARGITPGDACTVAAEVARKHSVRLVRCERTGPGGEIVDVRTALPLPGLSAAYPGSPAEASGRARAGPPP